MSSPSPLHPLMLVLAMSVAVNGLAAKVEPGRSDEEQVGLKYHPAVASADWTSPEEIQVELADDTYSPSDIRLKRGKPYVIRLKNIGGSSHDMAGGSFFGKDVIALRAIATKVGRITADDVSSVYIRPKQEAELWFVPIKTGTFSFICSVPGHIENGMEGTITVVD